MKKPIAFLLSLAILTASVAVFAAEKEGEENLNTLAVQNRTHSIRHEFSAWFGTLPLDAFKKGMTFSGGYTLHFNDALAWEVGQFTYSHGIETNLNEDLENLQQPAAATPFETVDMFATSSLVFKPIYVKMAALNKAVLFGEMFFLVGGGYGWMTITSRPVVNFGAGMRFYAGKIASFRIDIRDYMFINKDDVQNELWIALGVCLGFK